jgi:hypothetical protein
MGLRRPPDGAMGAPFGSDVSLSYAARGLSGERSLHGGSRLTIEPRPG